MFERRRGDHEVGRRDAPMARPPAPTELPGTLGYRLVDRDPAERAEQSVGDPPLAASNPAQDLDAGDL